MNLLLFEQNELSGTCLELDGKDRRARHIVDILGSQIADTVRVGMVNGKIGIGRILYAEKQGVKMDVTLTTMPHEHRDMTLILALPRPIMLQRILKQATVMGVRRFHLIRSARVQKIIFSINEFAGRGCAKCFASGIGAGDGYHNAGSDNPSALPSIYRGCGSWNETRKSITCPS